MMTRRSCLALLAAVPFAAVPVARPIGSPVWSRLWKTWPDHQFVTTYHVALSRPEWPARLYGNVIVTEAEMQRSTGPALIPVKFQHLRDALQQYATDRGYDSAAFRDQLHGLLDPYCVGVRFGDPHFSQRMRLAKDVTP